MMNNHNPKLFVLMLILGASNLASENLLDGFLIEKDAACEEQCGPSEKQSTIDFYVWEGDTATGDWEISAPAVFMDSGEKKQIRAWFRVDGGSGDYGPTWTVTNPSTRVISGMNWSVGPGDRAHIEVTGRSPSGLLPEWHSNDPGSKYAKTYSIVQAVPPDPEVPSSTKRLLLGVRQSFSVVVGGRHKTLLRLGDSSTTINDVHAAAWNEKKDGYFDRSPSSWTYTAVPVDPYWRNRLSISAQSPLAGESAYLPVSAVDPADGKGPPGRGTHRVRLEIEATRTDYGLIVTSQYDIWVYVP